MGDGWAANKATIIAHVLGMHTYFRNVEDSQDILLGGTLIYSMCEVQLFIRCLVMLFSCY